MLHDLRIEPRRHTEFCAGVDRTVTLLNRQHSACTDQHIRVCLDHIRDDLVCALCAEGHLCAADAAVIERLCECCRVRGILQLDDRHDAGAFELLQKLLTVHVLLPPKLNYRASQPPSTASVKPFT